MLQHLLIKNYALIQHLELNPDQSLNIITGETGAGKSIILGAIGLLLGNRMDTKALYNSEEKCFIEGHFDLSNLNLNDVFEEEELDYEQISIIRREISPLGKSRAFINDTPVNLDSLKKIGERLLDVHSQHDTTALASNEFQLQIVDSYAQNLETKEQFKIAYFDYLNEKSNLNSIEKRAALNKKDFDYNSFLLDELKRSKIEKGELDTLEQELRILENAEDVKLKLQLTAEYLYNADNSSIDYLEQALANVNSISGFSVNYLTLKNRLHTTIIELKDVFRETELALKSVDYDQSNIQNLQDRINIINNLFQKHSVKTETELLDIEASLKEKVEAVLNLDEDLALAKKREQIAFENMQNFGQKLSETRMNVIQEIEQRIGGLLADLGMPNASLKIEHKLQSANQSGIDLLNFLFSANKGIAPQQLKAVASGGEFSRLMLAIKYILASKRSLPTIIFDEIDTGVSGEISIKVGKMMKEMAQNHQIIAITHLHQIAAQGKTHYFVYKDDSANKTASKIKKLDRQERIFEIAQMIGGSQPSAGIIDNAKAILEGYE
ncbi:MAG: DNA repair protein RecN [Bacteroidota bacterium]